MLLRPGWIIILPCVGKKQTHPCRAIDFYQSQYFLLSKTWACSVFPEEKIFILSAKYGLISANQTIAPYDRKMGHPDSVSAETIRRQAEVLGLLRSRVCFIGGDAYMERLTQVFEDVRRPLQGLAIGMQLKALKSNVGKFPFSE